ncbi:sigma 54-interacting transcriptional regulator [Rhodopseudomonas sp. HC1]|uniref:sigma 54-interacting transcriptional regulator n=1 Tax=Rhodopseudomonas infernalis TaxID=2897386 RepID=UPI001EE7A786|nr:sigma 54-interacting transcriptional regulator [Rhodopseudomonas infernalis]MCG6205425.1 sigma 54-interacting transcriptional regulator [Rhodopseudomonas infernalis]
MDVSLSAPDDAIGNPELRARAFGGLPEATLLLDPAADRIVDVNAAACALLGHDRANLLAMRISALHEAQQFPTLIVFTQAVFDRGAYWSHALTPTHASGAALRVEYAGRRLEHQGRTLVLLTMSDLDQRHRRHVDAAADDYIHDGLPAWQRVERMFQNIERENQLILSAAGEGIYGVNAEGKATFVNPAAERMLGWTAEELVGRSIHAVMHHTHHDGRPYPDQECPIYAAFRDGAVHTVDGEVFWRKDGNPVWVEYTSTPIRDRGGDVAGAVVVFRDVSQRREADEKLHAALAEVDRLRERLQLENDYLQEEIRIETNPRGIIGQSEAIQTTLRQVKLVAPTAAAVLITGESGTGKELIARAIHEASTRSGRPLIRVNCAAIPRELFESEFFGHARGAFTGALRDRIGRFELADGGTLFLDEVGEIPLELQGKLLRVLQEGHFERVGDERTRKVDVRLIAATNRDLKQEVQRGRFREDLYFRLNVFPIESVPLRDRREDIPLLAQHFLTSERREMKSELRLSQGDVRRLMRYDWPGNVRELQNAIERATILAQNGRLRLDLPESAGPQAPASGRQKVEAPPTVMTAAELRDLERANIMAALRACNGKVFGQDGAAAMLDVKPTTLASRIKVLNIPSARSSEPARP